MLDIRGFKVIYFILITVLIPGISNAAQHDQKPDKLILIHLDSVSSYYLQSQIEAGNLPNITKVINEGGIIENAVTYFPSKTPTVISSLRNATPVEESTLVSWAGVDPESNESYTGPGTFTQMTLSKSRISAMNLLYGIPGFDRLAGIALGNLPGLLDEYRVLEFYWYPIDTYGHLFGEEAYLKKLRVFDKHFGRLMNRIDDDVNIILYADHGMTFGLGVNTSQDIYDSLGDENITASYPNLYISKKDDVEEVARKVLYETNIDFTFFRSNDNSVTGLHYDGTVYIQSDGERLSYSYEGTDPFEYYDSGYDGSSLTASKWLELTYNMKYPIVPVNIYSILSNPNAGDIITLLDDTEFSRTIYNRKGNHGGFTYRDISIPIILKGPKVEFLAERETLWLQNLFIEIENIAFNHSPSRDDHYFSNWYNSDLSLNTLQLSFSPAYRWGIGSEITFSDPFLIERYQFWGKFDLLRSYISRVWIGTGIDIHDNNPSPMAFIRHEFRYQKILARSTLSTTGNHRFALEYRFISPLSLQIVNFNSVGLKLFL